MKVRYPRVEINMNNLRQNVKAMVDLCGKNGIEIAGVIKGSTGDIEVAKAMANSGMAQIASSRLEQLEDVKNAGIDKPLMLIRIPMLSEVEDVIRLCDISLESELEVIKALNEEARKQGKLHKVVLMADLGDLREGFWDKEEMVQVAQLIENTMINIQLVGIGTNLGCYGSIFPSQDKIQELVDLARVIESKIGRELEIISGGATSSALRLFDGDMPKGINHLRIGEAVILGYDYPALYGYKEEQTGISKDVYRVKAEVIEAKVKPSYPVGQIAFDAFGNQPEYTDKGMRKKVLLAMGKVDYAFVDDLVPVEEGIEVLGASSDHTILDVTDAKRDIKVGDIIEFEICYSTLVYLTNCRNVHIAYV